MAKALSVLALAGLAQLASAATPIPVSSAPPTGASEPIPESFVSYSIEFAFFPDFAGEISYPLLDVFYSYMLQATSHTQIPSRIIF